MQVMIEKFIDLENKELYLIFIDYSKAFDKVDDNGRLFDIMLDMGIPRHLVELVAGLYNNQEAAVRWNGQLAAWFPIEQGTTQGCNVSQTEFNLYAERIMRTVEENYEVVVIGGKRITNLRYANDTTLLASTQKRIRKFFKDLVQESARYNMYINAQKSKIMVVSTRQTRQYFSASGP